MFLERSPSHSGLASPPLINSEYGDLTPFVPLSLIRRGGKVGRGASPLLNTPRRKRSSIRIVKREVKPPLDAPKTRCSLTRTSKREAEPFLNTSRRGCFPQEWGREVMPLLDAPKLLTQSQDSNKGKPEGADVPSETIIPPFP